MFKLREREFEVQRAVLTGSFMDAAMSVRMQDGAVPKFSWHLEIEMKEKMFVTENEDGDEGEEDEEMYGEWWEPRLYHNNGFSLEVHSWKELEGLTLLWDKEENEKGEEAGNLYVFEHEAVTCGKIEFLGRTGNKFQVRWSGTANVYWDEVFGEDVPFVFEGEVAFEGFTAECDETFSLEALKEKLTPFLILEEYELVSEETYENQSLHGMTYRWKFTPIV